MLSQKNPNTTEFLYFLHFHYLRNCDQYLSQPGIPTNSSLQHSSQTVSRVPVINFSFSYSFVSIELEIEWAYESTDEVLRVSDMARKILKKRTFTLSRERDDIADVMFYWLIGLFWYKMKINFLNIWHLSMLRFCDFLKKKCKISGS